MSQFLDKFASFDGTNSCFLAPDAFEDKPLCEGVPMILVGADGDCMATAGTDERIEQVESKAA